MNQKILKKWLKALRSGKYKQGKEALKISNKLGNAKYCCLGVLCDIHSKETGIKWEKLEGTEFYDGSTSVLPSSVVDWAGLNDFGNSDGDIFIKDLDTYITLINDDGGSGFKKIANILEKEFLE